MNLLFNKLYYKTLGQAEFNSCVEEANRALCAMRFSHADNFRDTFLQKEGNADRLPDPKSGYYTLHMKTVYPGLLIGIGLPHGAGKNDNDINVGFSFDYVSGQPYIPGSSVKGVLRHTFRMYGGAVASLLNEGEGDTGFCWTEDTVKELETAIFDDADSFPDAVLYDGDKNGLVLAMDTLAPHGEEVRKPPNVLALLKIRPDVRFEFRFVLKDTTVGEHVLSAERKVRLFAALLTTFGIGAKTNVGYGILEEDDSAPSASRKEELTPREESRPRKESRPASAPRPSVSSADMCMCPACGTRNFKYYPGSTDVRGNWAKNQCYKCKASLK